MAQLIAGETVTLTFDGHSVTLKIEDASKSEAVQAKILSSAHPDYREESLHEFKRELFA